MTKISIDDFKKMASADSATARRAAAARQEAEAARLRVRIETGLPGVSGLLSVARIESRFSSGFPRSIPAGSDNGHNAGLSIEKDTDGRWRFTGTFDALSHAVMYGVGYGHGSWTVAPVLRAMGVQHTPEAYKKLADLAKWGDSDLAEGLRSISPAIPGHVLAAMASHGSDLATAFGAERDRRFASALIAALKELGVDFAQAVSEDALSPLASASRKNDVHFLDAMLAAGADPDVRSGPMAPAMAAVAASSLQALQRLARAGADLTLTDGEGNGLLHLAVLSLTDGSLNADETIKALIQAGLPVESFNAAGESPVDLLEAAEGKADGEAAERVRLALSNGLSVSPLP